MHRPGPAVCAINAWRPGFRFFFKQWGEYRGIDDDFTLAGLSDHLSVRTIDDGGRLHFGGHPTDFDAWPTIVRIGKKRAGRMLDGREWNEVPNGSLARAEAGETNGGEA